MIPTEVLIDKINKEHKFGRSLPIEVFTEMPTNCKICYHNPDKNGYPRIGINGRRLRLSRYLWQLANSRTISKGLIILHLCDNPKCINLDHLSLGTPKENTKDAIKRTRLNQGIKNGNVKLTTNLVKLILAAKGFQKDIAKNFNISQQNVSFIKTRKTWKNL
jgi:hypothetical protein